MDTAADAGEEDDDEEAAAAEAAGELPEAKFGLNASFLAGAAAGEDALEADEEEVAANAVDGDEPTTVAGRLTLARREVGLAAAEATGLVNSRSKQDNKQIFQQNTLETINE